MLVSPAVLAACLAATAVHVQPGEVRPGDVVLVWVDVQDQAPTGTMGAEPLDFLPLGTAHAALVGLPVEQPEGELKLTVTVPHGDGAPEIVEGAVTVLPENFRSKELRVSRRFVNPSKKDRRQIAADRKAYARAWDIDLMPWMFQQDFAWPRPADVSAPFGDKRMFNGKKKSQHFGADIDGETGDPIYASNDGEVVMVRGCFSSGNTVLVHHGGKLFSAYFHLSQFKVKEGDVVERGQLLGLVGRTGRVTGPHLHFGYKLNGRWVNPEAVLKLEWPRGD